MGGNGGTQESSPVVKVWPTSTIFSRWFLVPKKSRGWRVVIYLEMEQIPHSSDFLDGHSGITFSWEKTHEVPLLPNEGQARAVATYEADEANASGTFFASKLPRVKFSPQICLNHASVIFPASFFPHEIPLRFW